MSNVYSIVRDTGSQELSLVSEVNKRFCEVNVGGTLYYLDSENSGVFNTKDTFKAVYNHQNITFDGGKTKTLGAVWLTSKDRKRAEKGLTFNPDLKHGLTVTGHYNQWKGFKYVPVENDALLKPLLNHIRDVIADGDVELFDYIVKWCAFGFQNPSKPVGVALVMQGEQGTGKGTLASFLCELWGEHALHISSAEQLTGRFNGHLATTPFIFSDEATYVGDKEGEQRLKALITENDMMIENKGVKPYKAPAMFKVIIATTSEHVINAGADSRRFCVCGVNDSVMGNHHYFDALHASLRGDAVKQAFMYYVLSLDLSGFNVRDVPDTRALKEQRYESLNSVSKWLYESLSSDEAFSDGQSATYYHAEYLNWCNRHKVGQYGIISLRHFGRYLSKVGFRQRRVNSHRMWFFGDREDALRLLCKHHKLNRDDFEDGLLGI